MNIPTERRRVHLTQLRPDTDKRVVSLGVRSAVNSETWKEEKTVRRREMNACVFQFFWRFIFIEIKDDIYFLYLMLFLFKFFFILTPHSGLMAFPSSCSLTLDNWDFKGGKEKLESVELIAPAIRHRLLIQIKRATLINADWWIYPPGGLFLRALNLCQRG